MGYSFKEITSDFKGNRVMSAMGIYTATV